MIGLRPRLPSTQDAIQTERLRLITITPHLLHAEAESPRALRRSLRARVASDWPPDRWEPPVRAHILAQCISRPETIGWHRYLLVGIWPRTLIGCVGAFPCAPGDVEIGYSVASSFQRQGFGSEAAAAFVRWLLQQPTIRSVSAQAYETLPQSVKVMQRCGMQFIGAGDEAGTVRYRRFR